MDDYAGFYVNGSGDGTEGGRWSGNGMGNGTGYTGGGGTGSGKWPFEVVDSLAHGSGVNEFREDL